MTDPAPPKTFPSIQGRCPACRGDSLFIGSGGWITCSRLDCPNPSAADQLLHGEQPGLRAKVTELRDDLYGITGARYIADSIDSILTATKEPSPAPTPAATRADTCGHTIPGVFGRTLGPCDRRPDHPELFHRDATGAEWRPTRAADSEEQPTPAATFSPAEYEDLKTRWSKTYGKPGTAHIGEDPQP